MNGKVTVTVTVTVIFHQFVHGGGGGEGGHAVQLFLSHDKTLRDDSDLVIC